MTWYAEKKSQTDSSTGAALRQVSPSTRRSIIAGTEAPTETPTEAPDKTEADDLDEEIKRIIREVPDPTPQPGGE